LALARDVFARQLGVSFVSSPVWLALLEQMSLPLQLRLQSSLPVSLAQQCQHQCCAVKQ
jgi:hypothetical protein